MDMSIKKKTLFSTKSNNNGELSVFNIKMYTCLMSSTPEPGGEHPVWSSSDEVSQVSAFF